ncbi:LuxR C-terminal-related transcriptional regulator [Cupriavidus sp. NPDC089707]|uniref:helix-turn-helix domain-containing protein n=1 Tax=Cupriavidus sp. NPDC089707 TaxID=3363963 RepID=UPI003820F03E
MLHRPQLVAQMAEARAARVIVLRAAAGFGKTTLMQQYAAHCVAQHQAVAWLRVDAGDNDLERLLAHLEAGLAPLRGKRGAPAEPGDSGPRLAHALLERVGSASQPFAIVLDDLETLHDAPALDFLQQLIAALPQCGTLVVGSRATPELGLGRLRARPVAGDRAGGAALFAARDQQQGPDAGTQASVPAEEARAARVGSADSLTARELEVLHMLSAGYRSRVIAQKLFVSELTVKSHLRRIHAKLGAQSRTEAVALARARGLIA